MRIKTKTVCRWTGCKVLHLCPLGSEYNRLHIHWDLVGIWHESVMDVAFKDRSLLQGLWTRPICGADVKDPWHWPWLCYYSGTLWLGLLHSIGLPQFWEILPAYLSTGQAAWPQSLRHRATWAKVSASEVSHQCPAELCWSLRQKENCGPLHTLIKMSSQILESLQTWLYLKSWVAQSLGMPLWTLISLLAGDLTCTAWEQWADWKWLPLLHNNTGS